MESVMPASLASASSPSSPWQEPEDMQVTIGGIQGFGDLSNAKNVAELLATGRVSLYMHWAAMYEGAYDVSWIPGVNDAGLLPSIAGVFDNTGGGVLELNDNSGQTNAQVSAYFQGILVQAVQDEGFGPVECNVNLGDYTDANSLSTFEQFVSIGESYGLQNFAPVFSPNNLTWDLSSFLDPAWSYIRSDALLGRGLAIDAPPSFYENCGSLTSEYEKFTQQEIKWGISNGLRVSVIISPDGSGTNFLADTEQFVESLVDAGAVPTQWDVENYDVNVPSNYPNVVGSESTPDTIANVALWVADNAPITDYTFSATGSWTGSEVVTPSSHILETADLAGNTATFNSLGQKIESTSAAGDITTYTYGSNGALSAAATFDASGQEIQSTDSLGDITTYTYDASDGLIGSITVNPRGQTIQTDPEGIVTNYFYNGLGQLTGTVTTDSSGEVIEGTTTDSSGDVITLGAGCWTVTAAGNDTVNAATGADTIFAAGAGTQVNGGSSQLTFIGGAGGNSVLGGQGRGTIFGGTGGGFYEAGSAGDSILLAQSGNTTLQGSGNGDVLWAATNSNGIELRAGSGTEYLVAGGGATTIQGGSGVSAAFAGTGPDTFVVPEIPSGVDWIIGFKLGTDKLEITGYSVAQVLSGAVTGSWGTLFNLPDGAKVILAGVQGVTSTSFA
jgi:YD repeat-containing protein